MRQSLFLTVILGFLAPHLCAETERAMTLSECIQLALQHNYDIQIERFTPIMARNNLSGAYGAYEPVFGVNAGQQYVDQPGGVDPHKSGLDLPYQATTDTVGAGLTGILPTGLSYNLHSEVHNLKARTDLNLEPKDAIPYLPSGIRATNQYYSTTGISLRQPLLKDFWIDGYRQRISIDKKNLKISELALRWQMMNTVYAVQQTYYELLFARERVRVQQKALELAQDALKRTAARVKLGEIPPLTEKQVEVQVAAVQTDLFSAQQAVVDQENGLKNLITDDFPAWADTRIQPTDALVAALGPSDRTESWRQALVNRADLSELRVELEKQGIMVKYRLNQLFPSLDVVGEYGALAQESNLTGALGDIRDVSKPYYSYGVVVSIPVGGNRSARGAYKNSKAAKQQAALRLKKLEQDVLVQVDTAMRVAQSAFQRTQSARTARVFAEDALKTEEAKLQQGLTTLFTTLQFQQRLTDARTAELRALADYNKALAQTALSEGTILEKNNLSVEAKP